MWEASASLRPKWAGQPLPIGLISRGQGHVLVDHVRSMLDGVGDHDAGYWHTDSVSVHFRCPLTAPELEQLPAGWLACPAVDTGGHEDRMTKTPPWSDD